MSIGIERKGYIAFMTLYHILGTKNDTKLSFNEARRLANIARIINVPKAKLEKILCPVFLKIMGKVFPSCKIEYQFPKDEESGRIACRALAYWLADKGIELTQENIRELGDMSIRVDIPVDELSLFFTELYEEFDIMTFSRKSRKNKVKQINN